MEELTVTGWRRRCLERQLKQAPDAHVYRRTLAILEVSRGICIRHVARALSVTRQTVHNWIDRYRDAYDAAALHDEPRSGRPSLWNETRHALLPRLLKDSPDAFGYFAVNWTVPLLQDQLAHRLGLSVSGNTLRRKLQELGYVWKRGRYELDPDPELEKKTADSASNTPVTAPERAVGRR
jgi:transposase